MFGCSAYVHMNEGKLKPRTKKCVFLGYSFGVNGYKLWCLYQDGSKFMIGRDVTFDKSSMLKGKSEATMSYL